jgi:threonine/homoserine/homoserine lactone efflux protein
MIQATAMCIPGQNHFLLLSVSHQRILDRALIVLGIASAGVIFSAGAAITIYLSGQAFSEQVFSVLGLMGSSFLIYLGFISIRRGINHETQEHRDERQKITPIAAFSSGFLVNLSNAKSVLFFGSVFATTLPLATMSFGSHVIVITSFFVNSILVHGAVSVLLSTPSFRRATDQYHSIILLASGVIFLLFAALSILNILKS